MPLSFRERPLGRRPAASLRGAPGRNPPPVTSPRAEKTGRTRKTRREREPDGRAGSEAKVVVACVAHGEGGRRSGSRRAGEDQRSQRADVRVAEVASKQSAVVARGASESREARRRCGRRCRSCRRRGTTGMKAVRAILGNEDVNTKCDPGRSRKKQKKKLPPEKAGENRVKNQMPLATRPYS